MERRTIKPNPKTLRQEIENNIRGINKYLHEAAKKMTWEQLLRNCHPVDRPEYAWRLYRAKILDWATLQEISPKRHT
jgi:hypothetical protein